MAYLHGAYGEITDSQVKSTTQSDTVVCYIGTAPINLVRGYADLKLVNVPIKVANMGEVQTKLGYSTDWESYTLCEAFAEHYDNSVRSVGPIYVINVLDPDTARGTNPVDVDLTFYSNRAEFESTDIILDTFAIDDKVEGTDYEISYNYLKGLVTVKMLEDVDAGTVLSASYSVVDTSKVTADDVIGQATDDGQYTGLQALKLLYQKHNAVLNVLAAPGWSQKPAVYKAMCSIVQNLNGHWMAMAIADIPLTDGSDSVDTIDKAIEWKTNKAYTSEFSKVCWPMVIDSDDRKFHLSTVCAATMLRVDLDNDSIPFESPSNKEIMCTDQYFGADSKNAGFDQTQANALNEKGITTACYWASRWVLWGPHTAAYTYNGSMDARSIFDSNIRMLEHIVNSFQLDHGTEIDQPMTPQDKDSILNYEQEKLDRLKGIGALIGDPIVEFVESENPTSDMINGDFVFHTYATVTPPFKSGTVKVTYTDDGFESFFEEA